jgi:hypothetical protein
LFTLTIIFGRCAFGILVRRWGILWRPLEMRFERRTQTIAACMRLHNFCIDKKLLTLDITEHQELSEIQPNRWAITPKFDKEGALVDYMSTAHRQAISRHDETSSISIDKASTRKRLIDAVNEAGLKRPGGAERKSRLLHS